MTRFLAAARLREVFASLPKREEGQTMAEYAVILSVITVGILAAIGLLSGGIQAALGKVASVLTGGG